MSDQVTRYNVFIASSSDVRDDREKFPALFNKISTLHDLYVKPIMWETDLQKGSVGGVRIQDDINPLLEEADLVIFLFYSRIGDYTLEEFNLSQKLKKKTYVFFKQGFSANTREEHQKYNTIFDMLDRIEGENHILFEKYNNFTELEGKITDDLNLYFQRLAQNGGADTTKKKDEPKEAPPAKRKGRLLTPPPFIPTIFEGRKEDLVDVHNKLFEGKNFLMLVNGHGGIGKTTFAAKYWQLYQHEYHYLGFLFVENGIADALLSLAGEFNLEFPDDMPEEQRLRQLIHHVAQLEKPCLLVLDNANNEDDLRQNAQLLHQCPNFHVLLTSRLYSFAGAEKHPLGTLDRDTALAVFQQHYQRYEPTDEEHFGDLYRAIGGNTLVLELFAKNLNHHNSRHHKHYTLPQLIDDIKKGLTQLSYSKAVDTNYQAKGTGLRSEKPEAIIMAMYNLAELSMREKQLLCVFALLPAESIPYQHLETLLTEDIDKELDHLEQKGWIEYSPQTKGYKISPVIQGAVQQQSTDTFLQEANTLAYRLTEQLGYEGNGFLRNHSVESARPFVFYAETLFAKLPMATEYTFGILAERIATYFQSTGNTSKALEFFELQTELFKELYSSNPQREDLKNGLAISYGKLGDIYQAMGKLEKALEFFELDMELTKELYSSNPQREDLKNGLAISYSKLGMMHLQLENDTIAEEYFQEVKTLTYSLVQDNPSSINNTSNYAEALAVSALLNSALTPKEAHNELEEAIAIWGKLFEISKMEYYGEKIAIVRTYQTGHIDYRTAIIKLSEG